MNGNVTEKFMLLVIPSPTFALGNYQFMGPGVTINIFVVANPSKFRAYYYPFSEFILDPDPHHN